MLEEVILNAVDFHQNPNLQDGGQIVLGVAATVVGGPIGLGLAVTLAAWDLYEFYQNSQQIPQ